MSYTKVIDIKTKKEIIYNEIIDPWEEWERDLEKAMDTGKTIPEFTESCKIKFKLELNEIH